MADKKSALVIINFTAAVDTFSYGSLNPGDSAVGIPVADIGPETVIILIESGNPIENTKTFPEGRDGSLKRTEY